MPLIVYLDTQDYLNLFYEPDNGPNHQVLTNLLGFRDRGEIVIGFSFATIIEVITKPDAANRPERVRRGQLIKDVCGPNAFPPITDLANGAVFPNGGRWMLGRDEKAVSAKDFRRQMDDILVDELKKVKGLNRSQVRQLTRKASRTELLRTIGSTWGLKRSDYAGFPVSDEIIESHVLQRFMLGKCSDIEFERRMNAWLSDPAEYSRIVYDYTDHPNVIDKYFGKTIYGIEQLTGQIQEIIAYIQEINTARLSTRSKLVEAGIDKKEAQRLTKQLSLPSHDPEKLTSKLEAVVGKGRVGHFNHYLSRIMKPGYAFKRSDVMDLMQMCYAYECDLFRCDKDMAHTFRDFEPFKSKLVGRFADLPDRISDRLQALGQE